MVSTPALELVSGAQASDLLPMADTQNSNGSPDLLPEEWASLFPKLFATPCNDGDIQNHNHDHLSAGFYGEHDEILHTSNSSPPTKTSPISNPNSQSCLRPAIYQDPAVQYYANSFPRSSQSWSWEDISPSSAMNFGSQELYPDSDAYALPLANTGLQCDAGQNIYNSSTFDILLLNDVPDPGSWGGQAEVSSADDSSNFTQLDAPTRDSTESASTPIFTLRSSVSQSASVYGGTKAGVEASIESTPAAVSNKSTTNRLLGLPIKKDRSNIDKAPQSRLIKDEKGNVQGVINVFATKSRARSSYTHEARASTALSRKRGACERCRRFKARCDMPESPYEPCKRCSIVVTGVLRQPCIRVSLIDIPLHRIGSTKDDVLDKWMKARQPLQIENGVPDSHRQKVLLTQDYGFEIEVTVAKFQAGTGDKVSYPWRDASGVAREYEMPPFYMIDLEQTKEAMREYNRRSYVSYIQKNLRDKNPIVWTTFQAAIRYSATAQSTLVQDALLLWSGARLIERPWRFCGANTLGLSPNQDLDSPWYGSIPVTPMMDTQLDHLVIDTLLNPLRRKILTKLFEKIMKKKKEDWFEIYLTIFVLMYNMERIFVYVLFFTSYYGVVGKFGSRGTSSLSESFIHACKTMLAYYHSVYNGAALLSTPADKLPETIPKEQLVYIRTIQKQIARQGDETHFHSLKEKSMYDTDMYWCHQLLFKGCQVEKQNDKEIDELQESDYLMHSGDD